MTTSSKLVEARIIVPRTYESEANPFILMIKAFSSIGDMNRVRRVLSDCERSIGFRNFSVSSLQSSSSPAMHSVSMDSGFNLPWNVHVSYIEALVLNGERNAAREYMENILSNNSTLAKPNPHYKYHASMKKKLINGAMSSLLRQSEGRGEELRLLSRLLSAGGVYDEDIGIALIVGRIRAGDLQGAKDYWNKGWFDGDNLQEKRVLTVPNAISILNACVSLHDSKNKTHLASLVDFIAEIKWWFGNIIDPVQRFFSLKMVDSGVENTDNVSEYISNYEKGMVRIWTAYIQCFSELNALEQVNTAFKEMIQFKPSSHALSSFSSHFVNWIKSKSPSEPYIKPSDVTFLVVMTAYARRGYVASTLMWKQRMIQLGIPIGQRHQVATLMAYAYAKQWNDTDRVWQEMIKGEWEGRVPINPNPSTTGSLVKDVFGEPPLGMISQPAASLYLDSFGWRGDLSGLHKTWEFLIQRSHEPYREPESHSQADSVNKQDDEMLGADPVVKIFKMHTMTENMCNSYIEALIRFGQEDQALEFLYNEVGNGVFSSVYPTPKMLKTVVGGLVRRSVMNGLEQQREELLSKAKNFSQEAEGRWPQIWKHVSYNA